MMFGIQRVVLLFALAIVFIVAVKAGATRYNDDDDQFELPKGCLSCLFGKTLDKGDRGAPTYNSRDRDDVATGYGGKFESNTPRPRGETRTEYTFRQYNFKDSIYYDGAKSG